MGNFFLIMDQFLLINCLSSYISYINIHLEKKIVDLKTGFLRIVFWTFIEVKRTIQDKKIKYLTIGSRPFLKDKNKNWYLYSVLSGLRNKLLKVRYSYCFSGDSVNNVNILWLDRFFHYNTWSIYWSWRICQPNITGIREQDTHTLFETSNNLPLK